MHLVISCNLKPHSRTGILARQAFDVLCELNETADLVDLQDYVSALDLDDAEDPKIKALAAKIAAADSVLLATPIYHFDVGSTTKHLIELTTNAWRHKVVSILGTAAGRRNYMAVTGLANSLMLEFHCLIVPYFVVATPESFDGDVLNGQRTLKHIDDLTQTASQLATAAAAIRGSRQIRRSH
jgi:NAD(P)H-dependent FMN reductase